MIDLLWMMLCLSGIWGLGCGIALSIAAPRLLRSCPKGTPHVAARAELIGLGFAMGLAATSYILFLWSFMGGSLGRSSSLTIAIGGILLGLLQYWRHGHTELAQSATEAIPNPDQQQDSQQVQVCLIVILGLVLVAVVQTLLSPQKFWDERAYYGLKAIVLFEDHSIRSSDLADPDFVQGHPRYPLLIPLAEQHVYALLGRVDDRLSKIIFPLMFTGLIFTFAGVLSRHLPAGTAWIGAVLLATTPVLMPDDYGFLTGQADAPVACYEGLAMLYLWDSLVSARTNKTALRHGLIFGAIFGAMVAFTKDEGISHGFIRTVAFGCALLCCFLRRRPKLETADQFHDLTSRELLAAGLIVTLIPALLLGPWFAHRRHLPMTGEMNYFGRLSFEALYDGLPTLKWSIPHLLERMFLEANQWGLQWWLFAMALIVFPSRILRPAQLFLLLALAVDMAALLLAGMIAPITLEEHIGGSSHRYLMQLAPGAVLFAIGQVWYRAKVPEVV